MPSTASNVDFPAPDGPMIETNSPGPMSSATWRRMWSRPLPCETDLSRLRRWIMSPYSYRSATIGSTLVALLAGTKQAASATSRSSAVTAANVSTSVGFTP